MLKNVVNQNSEMTNKMPAKDEVLDKQLFEAAIDGCEKSRNHLFLRHYLPVHLYIKKALVSDADADDVTQETFLLAHRFLASFQGNSKFSSWIIGIAVNAVRNHFNRNYKFKNVHVNDDYLLDSICVHVNPERLLSAKQALKKVSAAVNSLDDIHREAFHLGIVKGLPKKEAYKLTDTTYQAFRNRLHKVRKFIRESVPEVA
ncbi:RNA polymerase sigma factor [Thalassomonas viridans]|uniref:RNA polymerase sigma factor n=1 Tax=Thalassomonas viridans TaxID=137584 RepID=A0AAE9Z8D3_9GAMM|nr:RNA polymerase sigma factor [Thalassomonas viridans]WDE08636.1 RNA polymerase sigma factor [Thalassomonas viridans]